MKKRLLSLLLAAILGIVTLAGCGNSETRSREETSAKIGADALAQDQSGTDSDETAGQGEKATNLDTSADASNIANGADENAAGAKGLNVTWEDMAEINMIYTSMGPVPSGLKAVEDAINEITESEINTHVNLTVYEIGAYDQQIGLMMSSGEQVDLMLTLPGGSAGYTTMRAQGQLMDITKLLDEHGQPIKELLGNLLAATTMEGSVYSVPVYYDTSTSEYIVMRTNVLEDLGLLEKAQNMTSLDEYEEILEAVKNSENWSSLSPIVAGAGIFLPVGSGCLGESDFADMTTVDYLGDTLQIVCADPTGKDTTVKLFYETGEYQKMIQRAADWYNKGYIYKDAGTDPTASSELIKNNVGFSSLIPSEYGIEAHQSVECGQPVTCVKMVSYPITTGSYIKFTWGVPSTAKEPEAAVTFLTMMYTDSRIANLLAWGIEDVDYEVTDGIAHYVEGNENPAYHSQDYMFGNQFLVTPWDGSQADKREITMEIMKRTPESAYLGFSCDLSTVSNEIAAITTVLAQYRGQLETGMAGDGVYEEFIKELKSAGAQKVVDCYQEQLDHWLETK